MSLPLILGGVSLAAQIMSKYSPAAMKLQKRQSSLERAQAAANLMDLDSEIEFRQTEDPREQSLLKQSMFGRGLGKSTINDQARARLTDIQARRMAALQRNREISRQGLSLIRKMRKYRRRMIPLDILGMGAQTFSGFDYDKIFGGGKKETTMETAEE